MTDEVYMTSDIVDCRGFSSFDKFKNAVLSKLATIDNSEKKYELFYETVMFSYGKTQEIDELIGKFIQVESERLKIQSNFICERCGFSSIELELTNINDCGMFECGCGWSQLVISTINWGILLEFAMARKMRTMYSENDFRLDEYEIDPNLYIVRWVLKNKASFIEKQSYQSTIAVMLDHITKSENKIPPAW